MLKYSAREYLFRAALCHMCIDMLDAQRAIEKYSQMLPSFEDSREYTLLKVSHWYFFDKLKRHALAESLGSS